MAPHRSAPAGNNSIVDMHSLLANLDTFDLAGCGSSLTSDSAASSPTSSAHSSSSHSMNPFNSTGGSQTSLFSTGGPVTSHHSMMMLLDRNNNNNHESLLSGKPPVNTFVQLQCCIPIGDCLNLNTLDFGLVNMDDLRDCVRVACSNDQCTQGQYMHRECFEAWEQTVLAYMKSMARPRTTWTDKQCAQNLWSKKGYELIAAVCTCKCGRGHLKKDLDWQASKSAAVGGLQLSQDEVDSNNNNMSHNNNMNNSSNCMNNNHNNNNNGQTNGQNSNGSSNKKSKKKSRRNQKPILSISTLNQSQQHGYQQNFPQLNGGGNGGVVHQHHIKEEFRGRANSLISSSSSNEESLEFPLLATTNNELGLSPVHNQQQQQLVINTTGQLFGGHQNGSALLKKHQPGSSCSNKTKTEIYSDRIR